MAGHTDKLHWAAVLVAVACADTGCSTYDRNYAYEPRPLQVNVHDPPDAQAPSLIMLASIVGIRRSDDTNPAGVEVALRIDNRSDRTVSFDPATLALFTANVRKFPQPTASPDTPTDISPGGELTVEALFPFPIGKYPGPFDLGGLNLRWAVHMAGRPHEQSVTFARRSWRYGHPRSHISVGVGYGHGHGHYHVGAGRSFYCN
jgi:hypothetical protein